MAEDKGILGAADEEEDDFDFDDDDGELTQADLTELRQMLQSKRAEVVANIDKHLTFVTEDSDTLPDEMDVATRQSEQAYYLRIADKEKKLLSQIDRALSKFERGTYGICEGTGEPIGVKRLKLRPWTRYSLEYKEALERDTKGARPRRGR